MLPAAPARAARLVDLPQATRGVDLSGLEVGKSATPIQSARGAPAWPEDKPRAKSGTPCAPARAVQSSAADALSLPGAHECAPRSIEQSFGVERLFATFSCSKKGARLKAALQCICFERRKSRLSSKVNLAFPKESVVSARDSCSEERAELNDLRSLTQLEQREQILIEELRQEDRGKEENSYFRPSNAFALLGFEVPTKLN